MIHFRVLIVHNTVWKKHSDYFGTDLEYPYKNGFCGKQGKSQLLLLLPNNCIFQ